MGAALAISPETCMWCLEGQAPHQPWHPTRADLLKIGKEMSRRWKAREYDQIRVMSDEALVGYGARLRRVIATAAEDRLPDFLVSLTYDWLHDAEREWKWRRRAAELGADPVKRGGTWAARVEYIKREADLTLLIASESRVVHPGIGKWKVSCPIHKDDTPSLSIDTVRSVWHCFGCQTGGDAISYAQVRYDLSFTEAVAHLEERLGVAAPQPKTVERVLRGVSSDD